MEKIAVISRRLRFIFIFALFAYPMAIAFAWIFFNANAKSLLADMPTLPITTINALSLTLGFLANMIPVSVVMVGFYLLSKLFLNYEKGIVFSESNTKIYTKLAFVIFAKVGADVLFRFLCGLALTFQNPSNKKWFIIELRHPQIIFIGLIVLLVSYVMAEAQKISDEQHYIV